MSEWKVDGNTSNGATYMYDAQDASQNITMSGSIPTHLRELAVSSLKDLLSIQSEVLTQPLPKEVQQQQMRDYEQISGVVLVELNDVIGGDFDAFLDDVIEKLDGSYRVRDIEYNCVGYYPLRDSLIFEVSGVVDIAD